MHEAKVNLKILDIENIKLPSINNKFGLHKKRLRLFVLNDYSDFKMLIHDYAITTVAGQERIEPPYHIRIAYSGYVDIDAFVKPLLDGLESSGVIENDRYVQKLTIEKTPLKRGQPGNLEVWLEQYEQ